MRKSSQLMLPENYLWTSNLPGINALESKFFRISSEVNYLTLALICIRAIYPDLSLQYLAQHPENAPDEGCARQYFNNRIA